MENVIKYYRTALVKFALIRRLQNKEFAMLLPKWYEQKYRRALRHRRCHNVKSFDFLRKFLDMDSYKLPYNIYGSLTTFEDGIPRSQLTQVNMTNPGWNEEYINFINGADFFIDVDVENHSLIKYAHQTTKKIINIFNSLNVPYSCNFSGMGFHILVSYKHFKDLGYSLNKNDEKNIYGLYRKIAYKFHIKYSELVDLAVYDDRRLKKIPFSIACYNDRYMVAHEFCSNDEFINFELKDYRIENYDISRVKNETYIFNEGGNVSRLLKWLQE